jgi:hypothetical protein
MGGAFAEAFFGYCDRQPSALERADEAIAFADYLLESVPSRDGDPSWPAYGRDMITCERLRLAALSAPADAGDPGQASAAAPRFSTENLLAARPQRTGCLRVAAFHYDLAALYPKALGGEAIDPQPDPCFLLIAKVGPESAVRLKRINDASARLLTLCDGTRKLAEILEAAAVTLRLSHSERPAFVTECLRFLAPFVENGLIRLLEDTSSPHAS